MMRNYVYSLAIILLFTPSFASSTDESEKPTGTRNMTAENHNPSKPENQTCRAPYVSQQKQFVGVDEKRDVALFEAPPSNKSFFQRVRDVVFGEKS